DRDQRRREHGWKARLRKIVRRCDDHAAGLVRSVEKIVERSEELRLGRTKAEVDHLVSLLDRVFKSSKKCLAIAEPARTEHLDAIDPGTRSDPAYDPGA